jgi:hypothetical protein
VKNGTHSTSQRQGVRNESASFLAQLNVSKSTVSYLVSGQDVDPMPTKDFDPAMVNKGYHLKYPNGTHDIDVRLTEIGNELRDMAQSSAWDLPSKRLEWRFPSIVTKAHQPVPDRVMDAIAPPPGAVVVQSWCSQRQKSITFDGLRRTTNRLFWLFSAKFYLPRSVSECLWCTGQDENMNWIVIISRAKRPSKPNPRAEF